MTKSGRFPADVLRTIQQDWDFMSNDDCIPVHVGLQLMDSSTLGKAEKEPDFLRTYKQLQRALKSIVNGGFTLYHILEYSC
jgi:exocyst complex component 4